MSGDLSPAMLGVLVAAGVLAGILNTVAGGGSLVTLPALIFAGMPATVANGTNRVGVLLASVTATRAYQRSGDLERLDAVEVVPAVLGAMLGAWVSLDVDEASFRRLIAVVMLLMLVAILVRPKVWLDGAETSAPGWARALGFFVIGAYGGFLQAGVGIFLIGGFVLLSGHDLVQANARKVALVLIYTVPAVAIFAWMDAVRWVPGAALALGSGIGGWLGAKMTVSWGPAFVRAVLVVVVLVSSSKLAGLW